MLWALLTLQSIESNKKRLAVLGIFYLYFYIVMEERTRRIMKINGRSSAQCYGIVVYVIVHDRLEIKRIYMLWNPGDQILYKQNRLQTKIVVVNVEIVLFIYSSMFKILNNINNIHTR